MRTIYSWRPEKKFRRPDKKKISAFAEAAAGITGSGIAGTLSLSFVSEKEMAEINQTFVGHTGSTDVICFDYRQSREALPEDDIDSVEVEIIVCPAVAEREALKRALPYSRELVLYVVHGLLHSAGEDDLKPELKRKMRRREASSLRKLSEKIKIDSLFSLNNKPAGNI